MAFKRESTKQAYGASKNRFLLKMIWPGSCLKPSVEVSTNNMKMKSFFSNRSGRARGKLATLSLNSRASKLTSITLTLLAASILGAQQAGAQTLEWASSYNGIPASALEEVEGVVA